MPRCRACPSRNSRPSTRQPRPTCGSHGSWSRVVLSPDVDPPEVDPPEEAPLEEAPLEEGFRVSLGVFDGPFDLLLTLLSKHQLDITEVSLSTVTHEFIAYLHELEGDEELEQASEFLVVAATLLDMKVAG